MTRLGPRQKAILQACDVKLDVFTPPSRWMIAAVGFGVYRCPTTIRPLQALRDKGLIEFRMDVETPAERLEIHRTLKPGFEMVEHNCAIRLTASGLAERALLTFWFPVGIVASGQSIEFDADWEIPF